MPTYSANAALTTSFRLQSGRIHESGLGVTQGVGIRVILGESVGYAYSDDLSHRSAFCGRHASHR